MAIEIVDFPIKNGDFPWQHVSSPEGTDQFSPSPGDISSFSGLFLPRFTRSTGLSPSVAGENQHVCSRNGR